MIKDKVIILREFITEFQTTGTIFPSSKWAADALSHPVRQERDCGISILEAGPGSGPVTVRILKQMNDKDTLTLCELNPRLMQTLKAKLALNSDFLRHKDRITFYEGPVQNLSEDSKFDVIICAIPFLNLERSLVEEIFEKLLRLSNPGSQMTYFEYMGLRPLGLLASLPERRKRLRELDAYFRELFDKHRPNRTRVWLNLLPINVYTFEMAA